MRFLLKSGSRWRSSRLAAIFCKGLTGKKDFTGDVGRRWPRTARTFLAAIVIAFALTSAIIVTAGVTALWRSILGGRQIASSGTTLRTTAAMPSPTTASPTAATATITATITTPITAAAIALALTVATGAIGIVLYRIVMKRKVLGSGSVRIGLTLVGKFHVRLTGRRGLLGLVMLLKGSGGFGGMEVLANGDVSRRGLIRVGPLVAFRGASQGFPRENLHRGTVG